MKRTLTGFLFIAFTLWALFIFASYQQANPTLLLVPTSYFVFLLLVFVAMRGTGRLIYETLTQDKNNSVRSELASFALGFGILVLGMFLFGLFDRFYTLPAAGLLGLMLAVSFPANHRLWQSLNQWGKKFRSLQPVETCLLSLMGVWAFVAGVFALAPPSFYDTQVLYLGFPNRYAIAGGFEALWHNYHSFVPQNPEMLYTQLVLLTGSTLPAQLANMLFGILAALAVFSLGRRFLSRSHSLLAALLFFTLPGFWTLSIITKDDMVIAFLQLVALDFALEWSQSKKNGALLISALSAGLAAGCKYSALYFVLALFIALGLGGLWDKMKFSHLIKALIVFSLLSGAVASPWYLRTFVLTGNPVYPAMSGFFGKASFQGDSYSHDVQTVASLQEAALLPWTVTMNSQHFGYFGEVGILFLAFAPFLFLVKRPRELNWLLIFLAFFILFWGFTFIRMRLLFSGLAILVLGVVYALHQLGEISISFRRLAGTLLALTIVSNALFSFAYIENLHSPLTAVFGSEYARAEWFDENVSHRSMAEYVNRRLDPEKDKLLLVGETRMNYWNIPFVSDTAYDRAHLAAVLTGTQGAMEKTKVILRKEGFTFIVLNETEMNRFRRSGYHYFDFDDSQTETRAMEFLYSLPIVYETNELKLLALR